MIVLGWHYSANAQVVICIEIGLSRSLITGVWGTMAWDLPAPTHYVHGEELRENRECDIRKVREPETPHVWNVKKMLTSMGVDIF